MSSLTLIKLGGSVITDKNVPMTTRPKVLKRLIAEIAKARTELEARDKGEQLFLGHGQGSFGHIPAKKYQTMQGFVQQDSRLGMAMVRDVAWELSRIVMHELLLNKVAAVPVYPSNSVLVSGRKPKAFFTAVLEEDLKKGLLPVTGGDVMVDVEQGCTIWSTEEALSFFARQLRKKGWKINGIVHVTEVDGFLDGDKNVVPKLTAKNWPKLKSALTATKGVDVTGGMGLKVEESLALAKLGIPSYIISGLKKDNLHNILTGKPWVGTTII